MRTDHERHLLLTFSLPHTCTHKYLHQVYIWNKERSRGEREMLVIYYRCPCYLWFNNESNTTVGREVLIVAANSGVLHSLGTSQTLCIPFNAGFIFSHLLMSSIGFHPCNKFQIKKKMYPKSESLSLKKSKKRVSSPSWSWAEPRLRARWYWLSVCMVSRPDIFSMDHLDHLVRGTFLRELYKFSYGHGFGM